MGLTFKPGTDYLTKAPAAKLAHALAAEGAQLTAYDPDVRNGENGALPISVRIAPDVLAATTGIQAIVVMTEWNEIAEADWLAVSHSMVAPRLIFDGRNCLDPMAMRAKGFDYVGVGLGGPRNSPCKMVDSEDCTRRGYNFVAGSLFYGGQLS